MSIEKIDFGNAAVCDWCGADWTNRPESGGFLFGSKATCPSCAPKLEADAIRYGEIGHIRARCPSDQSFVTWVLSLRGGDNTIRIYTGDDAKESMNRRRSKRRAALGEPGHE